jgi:hypothetical protein|tara:strand:- start:192 stop:341 length:150 start_codon:yes stop_codon:yes gene_type:complete
MARFESVQLSSDLLPVDEPDVPEGITGQMGKVVLNPCFMRMFYVGRITP